MSYKPRIENSDRGITLSRGLAWTIFVFLFSLSVTGIGAGVKFGTQMSQFSTAIDVLQASGTKRDERQEEYGSRIRSLENGASRDGARFESVMRDMQEVKAGLDETNRLLRQLLTQRN
ncbi:hypothetical protein [Falsihalocynthiibacter arcticus]|uniref:hypothetical protein n=1 Tax=Falsihalocynthiibacter arcticus TaxID=1579316 RepID=UPI003002353E